MTRNWAAALAVLLVAGVCRAGGVPAKDKDAPTTFATGAATTVAPEPAPAAPCCQPACAACGHHGCHHGRECLAKCKAWLCFVPLRTCPCECKHCSSCYAPLYVYFLKPPCVEGPHDTHYCDNCSSCAFQDCAGGCGGRRGGCAGHGCSGSCDSCK